MEPQEYQFKFGAAWPINWGISPSLIHVIMSDW